MESIAIAGQILHPLPERALWWPAEQALIIADLHLEKASALARTGQMLPPYDSVDTINRLAALAARWEARKIYALGDSFHDAAGPERLEPRARDALIQLAGRAHLYWVEGNHDVDAQIGDHLPGEVHGDMDVAGLKLVHIAGQTPPAPGQGEISGHYHPKYRLRQRGQMLSRPCFILAGQQLILPAFGTLTGGLEATAAAFDHFGAREALICAGNSMHRFAIYPKVPRAHHYGRNAAVSAK